MALHYKQGGAGEGPAFPKTQSLSNLHLTWEPSIDALMVSTCCGEKQLRSACYMLLCYSFAGGAARSDFEVLIQKGYIKRASLVRTQVWFLLFVCGGFFVCVFFLMDIS